MTRRFLCYTGLCGVIIAIATVRLTTGTWPMDWAAALRFDGMDSAVLWQFRLPRVIVAALTGAAFGLSGTVLQTMLRNPLASPDVIGFTAGASAGAVGAMVLGGTAYVTFGALAGGALTGLLVLIIAWKDGLLPLRLVLVGLGFGLALFAITDFLLSFAGMLQAAEMARWLTGSFADTSWSDAARILVALLFSTPVLIWLSFALNRLELGDDVARSLGLRVDAVRLSLVAISTLLAATAVSVAGPLPFLAFLAGPIARGLSGATGAAMWLSALTGTTIALFADFASSQPIMGSHLPAGIFTALIGGPFLLALLILQSRKV
ncbi:FecCD family ABC transporter permease [Qingshengfaniella alkalisoli]|nr:iron ABC transporter permease [Qingshengfaniella alkalisoli]